MKKIIITIILTIIVLANIAPSTLNNINGYRNPLTLVSWDSGIVLDAAGNGVTTSPFTDSYYNYIHYEPGLETGTEIFSIFFYNPFTFYCDDIVARFDF